MIQCNVSSRLPPNHKLLVWVYRRLGPWSPFAVSPTTMAIDRPNSTVEWTSTKDSVTVSWKTNAPGHDTFRGSARVTEGDCGYKAYCDCKDRREGYSLHTLDTVSKQYLLGNVLDDVAWECEGCKHIFCAECHDRTSCSCGEERFCATCAPEREKLCADGVRVIACDACGDDYFCQECEAFVWDAGAGSRLRRAGKNAYRCDVCAAKAPGPAKRVRKE